MKRFIFGCVVGAFLFVLCTLASDWLFDQTTQWITQRKERRAATMLIDALEKKDLICTSGPLRIGHALIAAHILVIPRVPLQHIIEIESGAQNVVLHTVSIVYEGSEVLRQAGGTVVFGQDLSGEEPVFP